MIEKLVTDLAMPVGLTWLLLSGLCAYTVKRRRFAEFGVAAVSWFILFVFGNGFVAGFLTRSIERPYLAASDPPQEPFDLVVVLGGGAGEGVNGEAQIGGSGDRIVLAARLYHRGLVHRFLCTGEGGEQLKDDRISAGQASRDILVDLGVNPGSIDLIGGRNTSEEISLLGSALSREERIGLITSAWHMPRAMRLAAKAGIAIEPLPADFRSPSNANRQMSIGAIIRAFIPKSDALTTTTRLSREWLASLVGR